MARERSPNRDKAKRLYLDSNGTIKLVDIADKLGLTDVKIRKWKNLDKWDEELKGNVPLKEVKKKVERSIKKSTTKKNKGNIKEPIADEVKEVLENTELNDKQRLFCVIYVKCFNATKAYQKAYECDYFSAKAHGYELLQTVAVKEEIFKLKQNRLNRLALSEDDIFQRYIDIAFADITDYLKFGQEEVPVMGPFGPLIDEKTKQKVTKIVNVVKFKESTEIDGTIIGEVKQGKDGASIKLQDKMKALQWLSDRMDLLPTATKEKLELEKRKMALLEKQADDLDEDIEYIIEDDTDEEKKD